MPASGAGQLSAIFPHGHTPTDRRINGPQRKMARGQTPGPSVEENTRRTPRLPDGTYAYPQLQPVVEPQVSHFRQVPFRTSVKLPQAEQGSPT